MIKRRDRHGRGVRGPLAQPNAPDRTPLRFPGRRTAAEFFIRATTQSVQRLMQTCPDALAGVDIGVEDVPSGAFDWALLDRVPLAAAIEATPTRSPRSSSSVVPWNDAPTTATTCSTCAPYLVEQLSALTGVSMHDLDLQIDDDL